MPGLKPPVEPGIYLLADHLDAALAAGEDLLAAELEAPADIDGREPGSSPAAIAAFVADLKRLEASIAARVLQARRRAAELPRLDKGANAIIDIFQASSASALDLVDHFGRLHAGNSFDPGNLTPYAVLRSRGLLAPDAAELPRFARVTVTEGYRIGGVLPLGQLLNVIAGTLDALDLHFDLYLDDDERTPVDAADTQAEPTAPAPVEAGYASDAASTSEPKPAPETEAKPKAEPAANAMAGTIPEPALKPDTKPATASAKHAPSAETDSTVTARASGSEKQPQPDLLNDAPKANPEPKPGPATKSLAEVLATLNKPSPPAQPTS